MLSEWRVERLVNAARRPPRVETLAINPRVFGPSGGMWVGQWGGWRHDFLSLHTYPRSYGVGLSLLLLHTKRLT